MLQTILSAFSHVYQAVIKFFAHHKTYTAFLFVIAVVIVFYAIFSTPKTDKETYTMSLSPIKQYVKVSGQVSASKDASLSFQTGGAVSYVGVKIGEKVQQGKVLATLSASDAQATVQQAEANVANMQAVLEQLQQGSRKEEIAIKEQTLENAKSSLDQSYNALPDAIQNVDAITADVVKNKFAPLFIQNNGKYLLSFSSCDQRLQGEVEIKRTNLEKTLANFQTKSSVITTISSTETIDSTFELAYQSALATNNLVNDISNLLLASCSVGNSSLDGFRTTLSVVKTTMTTLFSDISSKRTVLLTSKNALNQANRDLDLTKAGTDPYKIRSQTALVASAEAQLAQAKSGLSKTVIIAPFTGVISDIDLTIGETATLGKTVITMLAVDSFEIEAKVPEIDIVKVKAGAEVEVTLDAYGKGVIFPATVTRINPTATTEGSVPVYKVIVTFVGNDERIKQGMTANVQIITENKSKVLAVPARFVRIINGEKGQVTIFSEGKETIKDVTLGVRGADGLLEVTSGLFVNDVLIAPNTTNREAQKQTN